MGRKDVAAAIAAETDTAVDRVYRMEAGGERRRGFGQAGFEEETGLSQDYDSAPTADLAAKDGKIQNGAAVWRAVRIRFTSCN